MLKVVNNSRAKKVVKYFVTSFVLISLLIGSFGCTSSTKDKASTKEGAVLAKSYDEIIDMKHNNKQFIVLFTLFIVLFTLLDCKYCNDFHKMLVKYLKKNDIKIYEVVLDTEFPLDEISKNVSNEFPKLKYAPTIYLINKNKIKSEFKYEKSNKLEERFDKWVDRI